MCRINRRPEHNYGAHGVSRAGYSPGSLFTSILGNHKENKLLIKKPAIVWLKRCNYGLERLDALPHRGQNSSNDADEDQDDDDDDDDEL